MVTPLHEGLVGIATCDLEHTATMLRKLFDLPITPKAAARLTSCDLSECVPAEYRSDAALLYGDDAEPKLGVISEVQLTKDGTKRYSSGRRMSPTSAPVIGARSGWSSSAPTRA
jgi:hypothetical protein